MTRHVAIAVMAILLCASTAAPQGPARGQPQPPRSPAAAAPVDLTGSWVSVVTEDWRYRMMTPKKGDYMSIPLNAQGRKVADAWDPATAGSCRSYGAAALMRLPTRLRITWETERILKIETDAGEQTRRLYFDSAAPTPAQRTLQGHSAAAWDAPGGTPANVPIPSRPFGQGGAGDSLKVVTTHLSGGWLRKNGVPYSENALVTEYYTRFTAPRGEEWFVVTTIVNDPAYLSGEFITSSHFRREATGAKWNPTPCGTP